MKKRVGTAYGVSLVLTFIAFAILMLRVFDPYSRWVAGGVYIAGWVALGLAIRNHARLRRKVSIGTKAAMGWWGVYRKHLLAGLGLAVVGSLMLVLVPVDAAPFILADAQTVEQHVGRDRQRIDVAIRGQRRALSQLLRLLEKGVSTDAARKQRVKEAWVEYIDHALELDQLLQTNKYFYQINALKYPELNSRAFLIGYAALAFQIKHGLSLNTAIDGNRNIETWLDEAAPNLGLSQDTFHHWRHGLLRPDNLVRLQAGLAYAKVAERLAELDSDSELLAAARTAAVDAVKLLGADPEVLVDDPLDKFERIGFEAWFPLQKNVAVAISDIRTTRRGNFVGETEIADLHSRLAPMDILLERRNWYVTNVGLPGFWPHAALYLGTADELDEYFDDDARELIDGVSPSEYLQTHFPKALAELRGLDHYGHENRVIEAIGEGVILNSLEHSANADYVAALRPRLSKRAKLASLLRALSHLGKPYDFDFDFVTDDTVVCSELVFKALQPAPGKDGVRFELMSTNGRLVLPPNDIAKMFDEDAEKDDRQLDFVAYWEGSESEQKAFAKDAAAFRLSWLKPKWDIAQR